MPKKNKVKVVPVVDDDLICPKTGKCHWPDWSTAHEEEDGALYLDVKCKHCGRVGCIGTVETIIKNMTW